MSQSNDQSAPPGQQSQVTLTFSRALTDAEVEILKLSTDAAGALRVPALVKAAYDREQTLQFGRSSRPDVGRLLSVLAATVPLGGRVLELGTGAGVGLAWISHGLGQRNDVKVVSVELDPARASSVQAAQWPDWVSIIAGGAAELLPTLGSFDLIFPDTPGGKIDNPEAAIAALRPGGVLLFDDMDLPADTAFGSRARIASLRDQLLGDPRLVCVELTLSVAVVLCTRRRL